MTRGMTTAILVASVGACLAPGLVWLAFARAQDARPSSSDRPFLSLGVMDPDGLGEQYHVDLYRSGAAEYVGGAHVKVRGSIKYRLSKDRVAKIASLVKSISSVSLDDMGNDPALNTSRPSGWLNVDLDGVQKRVQF